MSCGEGGRAGALLCTPVPADQRSARWSKVREGAVHESVASLLVMAGDRGAPRPWRGLLAQLEPVSGALERGIDVESDTVARGRGDRLGAAQVTVAEYRTVGSSSTRSSMRRAVDQSDKSVR